MSHSRFDWSGGEFGAPNPKPFSKSWTIKHNTFGRRTRATRSLTGGSTLFGEDAVNVRDLLNGLAVYAGYAYGTFNNMAELRARFAGRARLVSISPVVESSVSVQCLDIEPGDAHPSDAPGFMRLPNHDGAAKPIFYTSAGDLSRVISALALAGYKRDEYYLWSAHWIGLHICGPATCGYPQADATQYASNNAYDSDVWQSYVFGPPNPFPRLELTSPITRDPVNGVNAVHTLQSRLNFWGAKLLEDGAFGGETEKAVRAFQTKQKLMVDGIVADITWAHLNAEPPVPKKPVPATGAGTAKVVKTYALQVNRDIPGYKGLYGTKITDSTGKVVYDHRSAGPLVTLTVASPGVYTVVVGATGWANAVFNVDVPAS